MFINRVVASTKGTEDMKANLKVFLAWCIMEDDSEHGRAVIAHDADEAKQIVGRAWAFVKAITIAEATETTKAWKNALQDMYEKQKALLGV